jgi:hypothetical protein
MAREFDIRKFARAYQQVITDLAIRVMTAMPGEWVDEPLSPQAEAEKAAFLAEEAVWEQARAEGRVQRVYVPPPADNWDDGPFRDHWGHYEERIKGTAMVRPWEPFLEKMRAQRREVDDG